jgi:lysyl endopeptidase
MNKLALIATMGLSFQAVAAIDATFFPSLDVKTLHDEEVLMAKKGEAPRFAVAHKVSVSPVKAQNWEKSGNGYTWTHRVTAPNAVSLNFGFTKFHLPEGAELNIYSADRTQFIRTFTAEDNNIHKQLWSPIILTDDAMIELSVPAQAVDKVELELGHVGQGFRTFGESTLKAGACNVDVACSDSKDWEKEINAIGVISSGGSRFCTGFMVNNTKNDKTPFFMTANHCRITSSVAPSLVVYWNYQTSKCGGARDGKLTDFQSGSQFLAASASTDFTLVKLLKTPKAEWKVTYAGWDANTTAAKNTTVIHHPNVDEKSISFASVPVSHTGYGQNQSSSDKTHVRVADYDKGTTEPGSSGSPLFDENHRVIGQLHGGGAACGNDLPDWYGAFSVSWATGSSASSRLKDHLDSGNTGLKVVDTIE